MIPDISKENPKNENRGLTGRVFRVLVNNWPWKLLALFLAVCLWAGLISQDPTLTRERLFSDVPVSVINTETLRRNGLIVVGGLEEENLTARLRVEVPQREYTTVTYGNYNPRVDLSRITKSGEQEVKLSATSTTAYGTVEDISPATITVMVDEYVTNYRIPVSVNLIGDYPEGFYGGAFSRDPSVVALSGPKQVVDQVARIYVDYDAAMIKPEAGEVSTALPMRFVDRDGNEIISDQLEVTSSGVVLRSIIISQDIYPIRMIDVNDSALLKGEPARGYQVTGVELSPDVLRAAGDEDILNDLESLFVDSAISVEGASESFTATLRVKKPSELAYLNTTSINASVTIEPVVISSTFPSLGLSVRGMGSGLRAGTDISSLSAVVTGPQLVVESLRSANVVPYVSIAGLEPGEHVLPIEFHVEDFDAQDLVFEATPSTVTVNVFTD